MRAEKTCDDDDDQHQSGDVSKAPSTSNGSASKGCPVINRAYTTAEFPSICNDRNIFRRDDFVGGPVTSATIRFPPKHIIMMSNAFRDEDNQTAKHNYVKSLGRVVFARGPWIESHPLVQSRNNPVCNNVDDDNKPKSLNEDIDDKSCYKTLAFGEAENTSSGTSTFQTVSGMIFPSSSSSASYRNESRSRHESTYNINRRISVVAFGGRHISFLSGGGLWSDGNPNENSNVNKRCNEFASIPVAKHGTVRSTCLEVSDWIHDVRLLNLELPPESKQSAFLLAMGMANNNCDIFGFHLLIRDGQEVLQHTRLRRITCNVRCMTYSLSFHGWDDSFAFSNDEQIPSLAVASGTVFSEIVVWDAVITSQAGAKDEDNLEKLVRGWLADITERTNKNTFTTSRTNRMPLHRLKGHLGSIFSVRFSPCGKYIASTSDDRTIRLFQLQSTNETIPQSEWKMMWTGWGHTARVFDVSFAPNLVDNEESSYPALVSAGEDSTARIWSPLKTKEVAYPLRGHDCEAVWTVDVCDDIIVTGGNDGCVKLWDLGSRMMKDKNVKAFIVPKDPPIKSNKSHEVDRSETSTTKPRKKQKKKSKLSGQLICGMELCSGHKLVLATRAGGLFTLDTKRNTWVNHKCWHEDVISSESNSETLVDPTTGTCMSVSPSAASVILGTTEGLLIVASLESSGDSSNQYRNSFCCPSYRPVQSITWIDDKNVVVLYARGSVIWFKMQEVPEPLHILTLGTPGIPLSFAYDYNRSFYIGDSRGNLAYFDIGQSCECEKAPTSVLKAHAKEHVTAITVMKSGIIVSVGNDGCMHSSIVTEVGRLQRLVSIPVPAATGLKHIWNVAQPNGQENVILGGFYSNDYVVMDNISGFEFLRIPTGGRQKRQDVRIGFSKGFSYAMAICTGQKDGSNVIDFHSSDSFDELPRNPRVENVCNIGHSYHSETINDGVWVKYRGKPDYFLSGSNDCSVKLMQLRNGIFSSTKELPPHESCVRGVCSSGHPSTNTSLLVTCGGKLSMEFYILNHSLDEIDSCVSALCSYRTTGSKATIDHRMNAVRSVPLPSSRNYHLVTAGDSEGNLHVVMVSELPNSRRTTIGEILKGKGRPVLSLELVIFNDFVLAFVGSTGGEIQLWTFCIAKLVDCCLEASEVGLYKLGEVVPSTATCEFKAHQSGVNDLSVTTVGDENEGIIVCSVGDDQTISASLIQFSQLEHSRSESLFCENIQLTNTKCASTSALKSVELVVDHSTFHRVYTSGHDEKVTLWKLDFDRLSLSYVSSAPIGTEGSCLDSCQYKEADGTNREVVAVGGIGLELLSFNLNMLFAACSLREANALLITAGAGFSADSGLQTYEQAPLSYREMCNPSKLCEDTLGFQQFWLNFTKSYLETKPHYGYELLDLWCQGGKLPNLTRQSGDNDTTSPWWVYTSNVDGHFKKTTLASFRDSVCEIHGCALEYMCACGIGVANGEQRLGWEAWNERVQSKVVCKETKLVMSDDTISSSLLLCSHCLLPMRPNVLMFHDTDENILRGINTERDRYQAWEASIEQAIETSGKTFVVLELGCVSYLQYDCITGTYFMTLHTYNLKIAF